MTVSEAPSDWDKIVKKPLEVCAVCGEALPADGEILTTLEVTSEGFARIDQHPQCHGGGEVVASWRWTRAKELRPDPRRLDLGFLSEFFKRLDGRDEEHSHRVRWIVALLLLRKKILEMVDRSVKDDAEVLHLRFKKSEKVYDVADPRLDAEAMASIEDDLSRIFNLDAPTKGDAATEGEGEAPAGAEGADVAAPADAGSTADS